MQQITPSVRKSVSDTIRASISQNARIHGLFGQKLCGVRFRLFIHQLTRFLSRNHGAMITDNRQELALVVPITSEKDQQSPLRWWQSLFLFPFGKPGTANRFKRQVKELMPTEPHLLLMLLIPEDQRNGISPVVAVREELFKISDMMQLPIYVQTSCEGTKNVFESFGFQPYGKVTIPGKNEHMYFLKRSSPTPKA